MLGLPSAPSWIPEPFRTEWFTTSDPFVAGLNGAYRWWAVDGSPFRWLLDDEGVDQLLKLPGVSVVDAGPV